VSADLWEEKAVAEGRPLGHAGRLRSEAPSERSGQILPPRPFLCLNEMSGSGAVRI